MIRLPALCLVGCVGCAGLILSNDSPSFEARLPPAKTEPAAPGIRKLADPLFGPVQPRPEVPSSADDANSPLRDVRLTGVVIGPDLRIAIFAVSGADSLVLSEGETLKDWRLDRISPGKVLLSGPAGTIKLEAKPDANLVHPPTPVAVRPGETDPSVRPGPELAGALEQPTGMIPMPAGNLSAAIPVQAQGYPYYLPENYAGYKQDYLSYNYYPYAPSYPPYGYAPYGSAPQYYQSAPSLGLGFGVFGGDGHREHEREEEWRERHDRDGGHREHEREEEWREHHDRGERPHGFERSEGHHSGFNQPPAAVNIPPATAHMPPPAFRPAPSPVAQRPPPPAAANARNPHP